MSAEQTLRTYRKLMGQLWLALVFGFIYLISQTTIGILLEHLGPEEIALLQLRGISAEYYLDTFTNWDSKGVMAFYKAHFILDGVHWLWYTISLTALLALTLNANKTSEKQNWILLLPLVAGLCDSFENSIQLMFLIDPSYKTIVDPLPLLSTIASVTKWLLVSFVIFYIAIFQVRAKFKGNKP